MSSPTRGEIAANQAIQLLLEALESEAQNDVETIITGIPHTIIGAAFVSQLYGVDREFMYSILNTEGMIDPNTAGHDIAVEIVKLLKELVASNGESADLEAMRVSMEAIFDGED